MIDRVDHLRRCRLGEIVSDQSVLLPRSWEWPRLLQDEFRQYPDGAFPPRPPEFFSLELCGEAGELANLKKKVGKARSIAAEYQEDEAAAVLITLLKVSNSRQPDLAGAVEVEMGRVEEESQAEAVNSGLHHGVEENEA